MMSVKLPILRHSISWVDCILKSRSEPTEEDFTMKQLTAKDPINVLGLNLKARSFVVNIFYSYYYQLGQLNLFLKGYETNLTKCL